MSSLTQSGNSGEQHKINVSALKNKTRYSILSALKCESENVYGVVTNISGADTKTFVCQLNCRKKEEEKKEKNNKKTNKTTTTTTKKRHTKNKINQRKTAKDQAHYVTGL